MAQLCRHYALREKEHSEAGLHRKLQHLKGVTFSWFGLEQIPQGKTSEGRFRCAVQKFIPAD